MLTVTMTFDDDDEEKNNQVYKFLTSTFDRAEKLAMVAVVVVATAATE